MILTGGCLDPGCAYLLLRGLKTLDIRVRRACENAARIAEALRGNRNVKAVYYPGFADQPSHELARRQMRDFGMMVSFDIRGGEKASAASSTGLRSGIWPPASAGWSPPSRIRCCRRTSVLAQSSYTCSASPMPRSVCRWASKMLMT